MDQRVIDIFKAYHLRRTIDQAIPATDEDPEKTFGKDCDTQSFAWAWGDANKECTNGIQKTPKRPIHNCKGFAKDEELAKTTKAVVEAASNALGVDKHGIRERLQMVPEELPNEELLELEQVHIDEDGATGKGNCRRKRGIQKKIHSRGLSRFFRLKQALQKVLKHGSQYQKVFINTENCLCSIIYLQANL